MKDKTEQLVEALKVKSQQETEINELKETKLV